MESDTVEKAPYLDHTTHGSPNRPFWYHPPREKKSGGSHIEDIHELKQDPNPKGGFARPFTEKAMRVLTRREHRELRKAVRSYPHKIGNRGWGSLGGGHYPTKAAHHDNFGAWQQAHADWHYTKHGVAAHQVRHHPSGQPIQFGHEWDQEGALHSHMAAAKHALHAGYHPEVYGHHMAQAKKTFDRLVARG